MQTFKLEYNKDFGINKRSGWSVSIDGAFYSTFCRTPDEAIEIAVKNLPSKMLAPTIEFLKESILLR